VAGLGIGISREDKELVSEALRQLRRIADALERIANRMERVNQ
jgi:hypothetical protein